MAIMLYDCRIVNICCIYDMWYMIYCSTIRAYDCDLNLNILIF